MRDYCVYILWVVFALVMCSADSCESTEEKTAREQHHLTERIGATEANLANDTLSVEALDAFEQKAIQKAIDLADYLSFYRDTNLNPAFRNTTGELLSALFISDTISLQFPIDTLGNRMTTTVASFLKERSTGAFPIKYQINSIKVIENLHQVGRSTYSGKLSYQIIPLGNSDAGRKHIPGIREVRTISVVKKSFGVQSESLATWKVLLGEGNIE